MADQAGHEEDGEEWYDGDAEAGGVTTAVMVAATVVTMATQSNNGASSNVAMNKMQGRSDG